MEKSHEEVLGIGKHLTSVLPAGLPSIAGWALNRFLCAERLDAICAEVNAAGADLHVMDRILKSLDITYGLSELDRARIPKDGPFLVVANHPFGAAEGIVMGSMLCSVRPDAKIMVNHLLNCLPVPELKNLFIPVDPFGAEGSVGSNIAPLRECLRWLRDGGALSIFPSGEVSHFHVRGGEVTDPKWSGMIARLVRKTGAPVLPVYFGGRNSMLFQVLGLVHPGLRTLLLVREMLNKGGGNIAVRVGKLIGFEKLSQFRDDETLMEYLRLRTYILGNGGERGARPARSPAMNGRKMKTQSLAAPQARHLLSEEVRALPGKQLLVDTHEFSVYRADARQIPHLLKEIGRVRELTFREAGEGTGKSLDIDRFDEYYTHLFLWNKTKEELAGGYRFGLTDRVCASRGSDGLYTGTLFEYGRQFLREIQPAIELGRSFVRVEYQKTYQPLLLLWKGIGRYISQNPQYRMLFGPVSVNRDYHSISRQLIVAFWKQNHYRSDLARYVKSRARVRGIRAGRNGIGRSCNLLSDIRELSDVISEIEKDDKGIPVLLRHYLKLGGELLGFTVDHDFNDTLDVLILVDLTRTNPKTLERYMGKEGTAVFLKYHEERALADCS